VLLKNQRLSQLKEVSDRYSKILDERAGVVAASVTTARPLPEDVKNNLRHALESATGRTVRLNFEIDQEIIGGLVARIGSTIFDGSVQSQLERLALGLAGR
jgi:F-type H+-transporting ATPase subunit delta